MHTESGATPHCDAIHVSNIGLRICSDEMVQLVFEAKISCRKGLTLGTRGILFSERSNVTTSTKSFRTSSGNNYDVSQLRVFPFLI